MMKELNIARQTLLKLLKEYDLKIKGKPDEVIGKRFGKLVVLERLENAKDASKVYKCKCACGNTTEVNGKYLYNGDTRSCGCYEKDFKKYQEKNYKEALKKVGEKHCMLTIIDITLRDDKRQYDMICRCDCGSISRKVYSQIARGEIISCGWYGRELSSIRTGNLLKHCRYRNSGKEWYFIKNDEKICCRYGYEVIYANYLIVNGIKFEYEPETFKISNGRRYTPDFYLVDEDRYVEIKGASLDVIDKNNQKEKIELFRQSHRLDIYYWRDIVEICDLPYRSYSYYKEKADRLGVDVVDYLGNIMYLSY